MTRTVSDIAPHARLFELIRQQEGLRAGTTAPKHVVTDDAMSSFQSIALRSFDHSARR